MREIKLEKITLNVGAGKDEAKLKKGIKLITNLTGIKPVTTFTQKRIPSWGLRPGLPVGCKLTLRGNQAKEMLARLLEAKDRKLKPTQFSKDGNVSFGLIEYVDIPQAKYDPEIGMVGFEVCVTLARPGYRIKKRRIAPSKIGKSHLITKEEAIEFMKINFKTIVGEEE